MIPKTAVLGGATAVAGSYGYLWLLFAHPLDADVTQLVLFTSMAGVGFVVFAAKMQRDSLGYRSVVCPGCYRVFWLPGKDYKEPVGHCPHCGMDYVFKG